MIECGIGSQSKFLSLGAAHFNGREFSYQVRLFLLDQRELMVTEIREN